MIGIVIIIACFPSLEDEDLNRGLLLTEIPVLITQQPYNSCQLAKIQTTIDGSCNPIIKYWFIIIFILVAKKSKFLHTIKALDYHQSDDHTKNL